jgi:SH3-like domain-containing protein
MTARIAKITQRAVAALALAVILGASAAGATTDFCIVVTKTPDGFLALREGPGTQFKMMAKLKPGYPLDADAGDAKWTRVWIADGRYAWVYTKYTRQIDCPSEVRQ